MSPPRRRARHRRLIPAALVFVAACGADTGPGDSSGPTVADPALGGRYEVAELVTPDGADLPPSIVVELDADFGGLAVETPCGTLLGAFTLDADGRAGATITGGTSRSCSAEEQRGASTVSAALSRVEQWGDGPGPTGSLLLRSADGDTTLTLTPTAR